MKTIKILFQGDSVTDAGRDRSDPHNLGNGYPLYAAKEISEKYKDASFEFINLGISGNQTKELVERCQSDFVDIQPDIVSILVGVNDAWQYCEKMMRLSNDVFESRYRYVLDEIKAKTRAKLMMIEPFMVPKAENQLIREDLVQKIEVIRKLAREYADVYLPTDGLLQSAFIHDDPFSYSADGVHPSPKGAEFIGKLYAEYVSKLIDEIM